MKNPYSIDSEDSRPEGSLMSKIKTSTASTKVTYEAPKVSEETLDQGGNYVSPASTSVESDGASSRGTLGNSILE
jgi:hypothetical protein